MAISSAEYRIKGELLSIRNAQPEDAEELLAIMETLYAQTVFLSREPGEMNMTLAQERAFLQAAMDNPDILFVVASVAGEMAGYCILTRGETRRTHHAADVGICLLKAYWGKGIGRTLMSHCMEWARSCGVERLHLSVDTENTNAIGLYMRLGFVVEGRRQRDRRLSDGTWRDAYFMGLDL